ncbi:MAG TPA: hypothetical protein VK464_01235 [Symbiobacteriaceae bacterium]|jgi:hypothetical protein|nr:hypothetical protein [Symbiobacteriaceae bacterium]
MKDKLTTLARVMAMENGAAFAAAPGSVYDRTDTHLAAVAQALLKRLAGTGCELLSVRREGSVLTASINEDGADEPLCPRAFDRVVHDLAWRLLGEVWEGKLAVSFTPAPAPLEWTQVA